MKNISLALNGVLLVAVAVLYYLHFSKGGSAAGATPVSTDPSALKIAYINSDSVLKYYDYFKVNRDRLQSKGKQLDQDLRNRAENLQKDIDSYQSNLGNLTIGQAKAIEEDLGKKQQNLRMYQERLSQELMVEESKINQELYSKITTFLKKYGDENGLQVVFKYDPTSDVLYGSGGLDITKQVIEGLNADYQAEGTQGTVAKDTTAAKK